MTALGVGDVGESGGSSLPHPIKELPAIKASDATHIGHRAVLRLLIIVP
ncbi:hypothetical protein [Nocardia sp. NPDC058480]